MGFSYWHWRYIQTHGYFPKIPRERFRLRRVTAISFVCIRCNGQLLKRSARSNRFSKSYFWNSKVVVFPPPLCYVMGGQHAGVDLDTRVHLKNTHEEITASTLLNSLTFLFFPPPQCHVHQVSTSLCSREVRQGCRALVVQLLPAACPASVQPPGSPQHCPPTHTLISSFQDLTSRTLPPARIDTFSLLPLATLLFIRCSSFQNPHASVLPAYIVYTQKPSAGSWLLINWRIWKVPLV